MGINKTKHKQNDGRLPRTQDAPTSDTLGYKKIDVHIIFSAQPKRNQNDLMQTKKSKNYLQLILSSIELSTPNNPFLWFYS